MKKIHIHIPVLFSLLLVSYQHLWAQLPLTIAISAEEPGLGQEIYLTAEGACSNIQWTMPSAFEYLEGTGSSTTIKGRFIEIGTFTADLSARPFNGSGGCETSSTSASKTFAVCIRSTLDGSGVTHIPNTPKVEKQGDGSFNLTIGAQDSAYEYFWQSTPDDISETAYSEPRNVTGPGFYYLRAKNSDRGCWGPATIVEVPDLSAPSVQTLDSTNTSYVRTYTFLEENGSTAIDDPFKVGVATSFADGLGREVQRVIRKNSPGLEDLVAPVRYDAIGREVISYLPYVSSSSDGNVQSNAFTDQAAFYDQNDPDIPHSQQAFSYRRFENSPMNKVLKQFAPGETWVGSMNTNDEKAIKSEFAANAENEVRIWNLDPQGRPYSVDYYEEGKLVVRTIEDEQGSKVKSYLDINRLEVLKKIQGDSGQWLTTYYVYDKYNNLRYVLPPQIFSPDVLDTALLSSEGTDIGIITTGGNSNLVAITENTTLISYNGKSYIIQEDSKLQIEPGFQFSADGVNKFKAKFGPVSTFGASTEFLPKDSTFAIYNNKSYIIRDGKRLKITPGFNYSASFGEPFKGTPGLIIPASLLDLYAFHYQYDERNRLISKKVPGANTVYIVYDQWNRPVLTQDGNQRASDQWTFTKYDAFNRPIITGVLTDTLSAAEIQEAIKTDTVRYESPFTGSGNIHGYTNNAFPVTIDEVLSATYYDNYDFLADTTWDEEGNDFTFLAELGHSANSATVKGQVTGSKTKILGSNIFLNSVAYYDDRYRVIQNVAENQNGNIDRETLKYDFVGKVLETRLTHQGLDELTIKESYQYDHAGRPLRNYHSVAEKVELADLSGASVNDKTITKTASQGWGNAGFGSAQIIPANTNGWVETTILETNTARMIGLSADNPDTHYNTIDYATLQAMCMSMKMGCRSAISALIIPATF